MSKKERIEALEYNVNDIQSNIHNIQEEIAKMLTEFQRLFESIQSMRQPFPGNSSSSRNSAYRLSHDEDAGRVAQKQRKNRWNFPSLMEKNLSNGGITSTTSLCTKMCLMTRK